MIVTVTPNPSIDRTILVERLHHGEVNRGLSSRLDPGGKGVNVARALAAHQVPTLAVLPVGGVQGRLLEDLLSPAGVEVVAVPLREASRANIAVVEPDGTTTKINEPGPRVSADEVEALVESVRDALSRGATWLVTCGSLPPGADPGLHARLVHVAREHGARVAVDASGEALALAAAAGPDLLKPNHEELEELVGRPLPTLGDVVAAARGLVGAGVGAVVVSLGAHGAVNVTRHGSLLAQSHVAVPLSTVGAGDALLAGFLHAADRPDALVQAVAWGAAAVGLPGSQMPTPYDVRLGDVVVADDPDPSLTLTVPEGAPA